MRNSMYNMLTSLKNSQMSKKGFVEVEKTKFFEFILKVLWDEGYISGYTSTLDSKKLKIFLKYNKSGSPALSSIQFLSKPGRRLFYTSKQIWKLESSQMFILFSTNKGVKTILECKRLKIGGEPLFLIK